MSFPLKLYMDSHISKAVVIQLRIRNVDVVHCADIGLGDADDETHLATATAQERAVVTHDQDFLRWDNRWRADGKSHGGIFFIQPELQGNVGQVVTRLLEYHEMIALEACTVADDIADRVTFIG